MQYPLGIIGVGEFASHLVTGFMRSYPGMQMILSPRGRQHASVLREEYGHAVAESNAEVVERSEIVLVATRPAQLEAALEDLPWTSGQLVISVAAGVGLGELEALVSPADAVLCMPTNSAMIGASVLPVYPDNPRAVTLLRALGRPTVLPDEDAFNASAVLGAYYGWLLRLMAVSSQWLEDHDVPEEAARALIENLFAAAAEVSRHRDDSSFDALADELRLPGGITEHGLDLFAESGGIEQWREVMEAVLARLSERY